MNPNSFLPFLSLLHFTVGTRVPDTNKNGIEYLHKIEILPGIYTHVFYNKKESFLTTWNENNHEVMLYDIFNKVLGVYNINTKICLFLNFKIDIGYMMYPNFSIRNLDIESGNLDTILNDFHKMGTTIKFDLTNHNNCFKINGLFITNDGITGNNENLSYNLTNLMKCRICKNHASDCKNILKDIFKNIKCSSKKKNFQLDFFYGTNRIPNEALQKIRVFDVEDLISLMRQIVCKNESFCKSIHSKLVIIGNRKVCINNYLLDNNSWQIKMKNQLGDLNLLVQYNSTLNILAFLNKNLKISIVFNGKSGFLAIFNTTTGIGAVVNQFTGNAKIVNKYQQEIKTKFKETSSPLELQNGFHIILNAIQQSSQGLQNIINFDNDVINMNNLFSNFFNINDLLSKKTQAEYKRAINNFGALFEQTKRQLGDIGKICINCGIISLTSSVVGLKDFGLDMVQILDNLFNTATSIFKPKVIYDTIMDIPQNFSDSIDTVGSFIFNGVADFFENVKNFTGNVGEQIKKFFDFCKLSLSKEEN